VKLFPIIANRIPGMLPIRQHLGIHSTVAKRDGTQIASAASGFLASLVCILILGAPSSAQQTSGLPAHVEEHYEPHPQVGGSGTLVGLEIGPLDGPADPEAFRVPIAAAKGQQVCVHAMSSDSKYWSTAKLKLPMDRSGPMTIRPDNGKWQYLSQLSSLRRDEFAVLGYKGADCIADDSSVFFPVSYEGSQNLLTAVFAAPRVALVERATLTFANHTEVNGDCQTKKHDDPRALGFNVLCKFSLPSTSATGAAKLEFARYDRTGGRTDSFDVVLP
jgi:hypothetical protein